MQPPSTANAQVHLWNAQVYLRLALDKDIVLDLIVEADSGEGLLRGLQERGA